jgi:hypothetical protein
MAGGAVMAKYGNRKTVMDGITFASAKEARRYSELKLLERTGWIADLKVQPRFPITVCGIKVCTYVADFQYRDLGVDALIVEDVKGFRTPEYKLKAKLFRAVHGFPVTEV